MTEAEFAHFGRMNDPDGSAYLKGICGDEMEFYFIAKKDMLQKVLFYTDGCEHTRLCGETAACLVEGKSIDEALDISPAKIRGQAGDIPEDHVHCTILAAMTLFKALAEYVYKRSI